MSGQEYWATRTKVAVGFESGIDSVQISLIEIAHPIQASLVVLRTRLPILPVSCQAISVSRHKPRLPTPFDPRAIATIKLTWRSCSPCPRLARSWQSQKQPRGQVARRSAAHISSTLL